MNLIAWRTIGKNPCHNPPHSTAPATITIAPQEKGTGVWPWILPLERAVEMFGQDRVDMIGEEPVAAELQILI